MWRLRLLAALSLVLSGAFTAAQTLAPRAYVITPTGGNAITLAYGFYEGELELNGALPIANAKGKYSVPVMSLYHAFGLFGRSANVTAVLPYGVGNFEGNVLGEQRSVYRSGLLDAGIRFSLNLKGGPAMTLPELRKWKQKTLVGVSFLVVIPTGQYDRTRLINWGANRWAFKPEVGLSRRWGKWIVDAYGAVWFYTANPHFFEQGPDAAPQEQTQKPTYAFEGHLSYDVRPRFWVSLDGNYWAGGKTSLNGVENEVTFLGNSRIGGTASFPLNNHQSLKVGYNRGAYIRFGGDYNNISVAWQYSWIGKPK